MEIALNIEDPRVFSAIDSFDDFYIYKSYIEPIYNKKIMIVFVEGKSGEGKSYTSLSLAERIENIIARIEGTTHRFDPVNQVIYTPKEYNEKIKKWTLGHYGTIIVEEMRQLVSSKRWYSLLAQSIAEGNATLRAIKFDNCGYGGIMIYNSQDIGDVTKDVRRTVNKNIVLKRYSEKVVMRAYEFWFDRSNIEKPIMRPKRDSVKHEGVTFQMVNAFVSQPSKDIRNTFDKISIEAKAKILENKRKQIMKGALKEMGEYRTISEELKNDKIFEMVKNMAMLRNGKVQWTKQNKEVIKKLFDLSTDSEFNKQFKGDFVKMCERKGLLKNTREEPFNDRDLEVEIDDE